MSKNYTNPEIQKGLENLLIQAGIKVRELDEILNQTNVAKTAGKSKQAIQQRAAREASK